MSLLVRINYVRCVLLVMVVSLPCFGASLETVDKKGGRIDFSNHRLTLPVKIQIPLASPTSAFTTEQISKALDEAESENVKMALSLVDKVLVGGSVEKRSLLTHLTEKGWKSSTIEEVILEKAKSVNTMFYKKGRIAQIYRLSLSEFIRQEDFPDIDKPTVGFCTTDCDYSGLVITLPAGTMFKPALIFSIRSESKKVIYDRSIISFSVFQQSGMGNFAVGSSKTKSGIVGEDPLEIEALPITTPNTIVISDEDANEVTHENQVAQFFQQGKVVVIFTKQP